MLKRSINFHRYSLGLSLGLVVLLFLLPRLPYLLNGPFPVWHYDTVSYLAPLDQIMSGQWPLFDQRPPGYPLFLWLMSLFRGIYYVPVVQMGMTLASALFLVCSIFQAFPRLVFFSALGIGSYVISDYSALFDATVSPESLFASCIVLILGTTCLVINAPRNSYLWGLALCSAILLSLRPAGLFLLLINLLVAIHLSRTKFSLLKSLIPVASMVLLVVLCCSYNKVTLDEFDYVPFGSASLAGATSTFWEPHAKLPVDYNEFILRHKGKTVTDWERSHLDNSWKLTFLDMIFLRHFDDSVLRGFLGEKQGAEKYRYMKLMAFNAVVSHPQYYLKFVVTQLRNFYSNFYDDLGFVSEIKVFNSRTYLYDDNGVISERYKKYFTKKKIAPVKLDKYNHSEVQSNFISFIKDTIYRNEIFFAAFFLLTPFMLAVSFFKRKAPQSFLLIVIISLFPILSSILVAMSQRGLYRYWYPTDSAFKLTVWLAVGVLFLKLKDKMTNK